MKGITRKTNFLILSSPDGNLPNWKSTQRNEFNPVVLILRIHPMTDANCAQKLQRGNAVAISKKSK